MLSTGARFVGQAAGEETAASTISTFAARFSDVPSLSFDSILGENRKDLVITSAIPGPRAEIAIAAMEAGADVMVDKPDACRTGAATTDATRAKPSVPQDDRPRAMGRWR